MEVKSKLNFKKLYICKSCKELNFTVFLRFEFINKPALPSLDLSIPQL